jgi:hypothetical protein
LAAALVVGAVFVVPPAALACNSGVSAVDVYKECLPTGGGGKPTSGGGTPTSGGSTGSRSVPISRQAALALKKAGKDGRSLSALVQGFGATRLLEPQSAGATAPTAVSAAFDLGSGPTALVIVLAGTGILLLVATGFRSLQHRRR